MFTSTFSRPVFRRTVLLSSAVLLVQSHTAIADDFFVPPNVFTEFDLLNDGDTLTVDPDGIIDTTGNVGENGVSAQANNQSIWNGGTIIGQDNGIRSSGDNNAITNDGVVTGIDTHGINITDGSLDNVVINNGRVIGANSGIRTDDGSFVAGTTIYNHGYSQGLGSHGIRSGGNNETVVNTGTAIGFVNGVFIVGSDTQLTNSGFLKGETGASISIGAGGMDAIINLLAGSVLDGIVFFESTSATTLNIGSGLNLYLAYQGTDPTVNSAIPFVYDDDADIIYTVDPTGLALSQAFIQTMSDAVHGAVQSGTGFGNGVGGGFSGNDTFAYGANAPGFADEGPRGWASAFGGYQSQDGSGAVTGADQAYGGLVTGGGFASSDRMYGVFAGGSYSRLETDNDTQEIDAASFYGGVYGGMTFGANWLSSNFVLGYTNFDSDRTVANNLVAGGLETASADYDGYFISPSITLGRSLTDRLELSVGGHYAGLFLDGYTETGSQANLTVASRDVHVAAARAQVTYLAFERPTGGGRASVETWAGIDGYFNLGSDDVSAVLAGTTLNFPASFADSAAIGFVGLGVNHKPVGGNWHWNTSVEGRYGTDDYAEIRASASVGRKF